MRQPVWRYRFTRVPDTDLGRSFGAYHGLEVAYVFGNLSVADGDDATDVDLSRAVMAYWTNFARNGDPNAPGLPVWPQHEAGTENAIELRV